MCGIWHEDRFRPLVTAVANLGLNLIMVRFWGIYGILLSTVISMLLVGMPWLFHNLFTTLFEWKWLPHYLKKVLLYTAFSIGVSIISSLACYYINLGKWSTLFARLIVCFIVPNVSFFIIYHNTEEYIETLTLVNGMTKGKIAGLLRWLGMK